MRKYRLNDDAIFNPDKHKMTPEEENRFDEYFEANFAAFCETMERKGYA